ncbi:hypothetical protein ACNHKD_08795 [Methylocystis sp. JAN1]|uniref:hypothetical protein n=1 Tax=Methylocystis sp. JAN1 TaxID=3397211 RepID=UPI003FA22EE5
MFKRFLPATALAGGLAFVSTLAYGYTAAAPVLIPPAFERPMSPAAACAAEAQEQFLSGPAFDSFMATCTSAGVARLCDHAASVRKLTGKKRAVFTRECAIQVEEAQN